MVDKPDPGRLRLRAASYNIHRCVGADGRCRPERVAQVIRELDAAVIGLQEVDWKAATGPDGAASQAEFLAHLAGYTAIEGPNLLDQCGHYGNMLLTRFPVRRVTRLRLRTSRREPRGAIDAEIDCDGLPLRVLVTHLGLGLRERQVQAAQLARRIARRPRLPTLLLGDLNDWIVGNPTIRPLINSSERAGRPRSFPAQWPVFALDRILGWGLGAPLRIHAHRSPAARAASDHLPVLCEVDLPRRTVA